MRIKPVQNPAPGAFRLALGLISLCALFVVHVHAARVAVDGIVAVVDGTPILLSDVEELRQAMLEEPGFAQTPVAQQRRDMLDPLIDEKVHWSPKPNRTPTLGLRTRKWNCTRRRMVRASGGAAGRGKAARACLGAIHRHVHQPSSRIAFGSRCRSTLSPKAAGMKFVGDFDPSQLQVREFFAKYKDSLPVQRGHGVHLSHIQWRIKASDEIDSAALAKANALDSPPGQGESFSDLAKSYSDDYSGKDAAIWAIRNEARWIPDLRTGCLYAWTSTIIRRIQFARASATTSHPADGT